MDGIKSYTTLIGLTVEQVAQKLDEQLPKDAYKPVPGAAGFTDIDPNYMRQVLNNVFGMCGFGWGYTYDPGDLIVTVEERTTKEGRKRRVYVASLKRLRFWYKLNGTNVVHICDVYASGGSDNDVEGYALSGAITNAIGKAASNLGFQESVYLGKRDHNSVKKPASSKSDPQAAAKPAPVKPAPKAEVKQDVVSDEIVDADMPATASSPSLDDAVSFVITDKMTQKAERVGQPLGTQSLEAIKWWADKMKPANEEQEALQKAAQTLIKVRSNGHEPVAA